MIVAETILKLSGAILLEIVCKRMHDPLQDDRIYDCSCDGAYIVMDNALKSFANIHATHSRTITMYDYSRDSAYIVIGDAI